MMMLHFHFCVDIARCYKMAKENLRPKIPKNVQSLLWLRAAGRCEFRGCNKILYEDQTTQDPINESNIAHIISWIESGPRGDKYCSPKLAIDISNLMLTCPEHNHLIDSGENVEKYSVSILQEMKREHENSIRELTELRTQPPKRVIEMRSMIHGQRPLITHKEEADAMFPFYPHAEKIVIDVCDVDDIEAAKIIIDSKVKHLVLNDGGEFYAAFIMALIPLGCYLGYAIGNKIPVQTFQHFRDSEDWKWRDGGGSFVVSSADNREPSENVNLLINVSGIIDKNLVTTEYPTYSINADHPGFDFLQSWKQIVEFRQKYRDMLDKIRMEQGESVTVHLYLATPNPINFEIGKGIMKNLDPTIILYDKASDGLEYRKAMCLHKRVR